MSQLRRRLKGLSDNSGCPVAPAEPKGIRLKLRRLKAAQKNHGLHRCSVLARFSGQSFSRKASASGEKDGSC
jgi:hypothetical protein